jgi:hypothetical protein
MQSPRRLRFDFRAHDDASNTNLLDVLEAAAASLAQVVTAAPPGARALHTSGMADRSGFLAMGCGEILVHGWDVVRGLGGEIRTVGGHRRTGAPQALSLGPRRRVTVAGPALGERPGRPSWPTTCRAGLGLALRAAPRVGRHRAAPDHSTDPRMISGRGGERDSSWVGVTTRDVEGIRDHAPGRHASARRHDLSVRISFGSTGPSSRRSRPGRRPARTAPVDMISSNTIWLWSSLGRQSAGVGPPSPSHCVTASRRRSHRQSRGGRPVIGV